MTLSIKAVAITSAILWGAAVFLTGLAHVIWPNYGTALLELLASIYPGYAIGGFGSVLVATLYAVLDGGIGGAVFAWLYNRFATTPAAV